jgi:hypothetical protein
MTIRLDCPDCGKTLPLSDDMAGRSVRCPGCAQVVRVPRATREGGITSQAGPPRLAMEEPPPVQRPRPKTGGPAALILGIIAIALGVLALATSWIPFVCIASGVMAAVGVILAGVGVLVGLIYKGRGTVLCCAGGALNLLALIAAIGMTIVTVFSSPFLAICPDEPQPEATVPDWGQVYDPDGDCTCALEQGGLSIRIPGTAHDLSAEIGEVNAPRVLQEVEGDFTARVKVCGVLRPTAPPAVLGRTPFQSGGLLLYHDRNNYIRLERSALRRGAQIQWYASIEQRSNGNVILPAATTPIPEGDVSLRLERQGNQVFGYVTADGQPEVALQPVMVGYPAKVLVGVAAVNAAQQPLALRFEQFTVQKK